MTVAKYDGISKKFTSLQLLFCYFLKGLIWYHTYTKFHSQGIPNLEIVMGESGLSAPKLFNVKKPMLCRVKSLPRMA